ncbi:HAD-IA family hydrolase [Aliiglaciecola sp. CAU 1673]|uniref:HAD-IA family hydrolase n=1 Tax=Aliiglaciecola sp. CAU 1673 TaxID=3032595 RepID=UPI0023DC0C55|nr:HAD-IA family hydrolase [Aliiglaciecola sp. CAU 1673]MDF2177647.1 HAD-IA family hydrolase [Aliiglaciecola sp. CAU 1673]
MHKLVIFDWDGTLMDSGARIVSAMQTSARRAGLPVPSEAAVKDIIGISLQPAMVRLFGALSETQAALLLDCYREEYVERDSTPTPMFAGAYDLLDNLKSKGVLMAVATGKARRGLHRVWQETATGHYFVTSRCGDETASKPHPQMLSEILLETGIDARHAVMIGDTTYDMQMAEQLKMDRIAMSHGVHEEARLAAHSPLTIADSLTELQAYLLG